MSTSWNGRLAVDIRDAEPDWAPYTQPTAPTGAPNVLLIAWDDVGYGAMEVHGGPIETPAMVRIAESGVTYGNFHTTALCSPTRSSLLNGRNATSNSMACIAEATTGFPGSNGRIPFENGLISEVLGERGWNTYCVGKWHLTPEEEMDASSWRKRWPLGRGFERFYGFLGGETNQWYPDLVYDNHPIEPPSTPEEGYHLSKDLADRAIGFVGDAKAAAPNKPFFLYLAPGCGHAPHHVATEWADRYRGRFDQGYEAIRAEILTRQKAMGLMPASTELSVINPHGEPETTGPAGQPWPQLDWVRPWDSLSADERRLFVRMAEVYAGFVTYTDHQIGRVLDFLADTDQLDNTIIVAVSDNGASAEGGPNGSFNENKFFNGVADTIEANLARIDELGTPASFNHYCSGWAWAFDTPFPYWKRFAGYEGGTADMCLISWPDGLAVRGEIRHQYIHAVDVVPTLYSLLDIDPPGELNGYTQSPLEGESFAASLGDPEVAGRGAQFYSMLGQRAMYRDGWLACSAHPPVPSNWSHFDQDRWELYHLVEDRSQSRDRASEHPDLLQDLIALWWHEAGRLDGLPLDDRTAVELLGTPRPGPSEPRNRYRYLPGIATIPEAVAVNLRGRSFTIAAGVEIEDPDAEGTLFSFGGLLGGLVLYRRAGELCFTYNWLGEDVRTVAAPAALDTGRHVLTAEFVVAGHDDETPSSIGPLRLFVDEEPIAEAEIKTQPGKFGLGGGGLSVGYSSRPAPDPSIEAPFPFVGGHIEAVVVDVSGDAYLDFEAEVRSWLARD